MKALFIILFSALTAIGFTAALVRNPNYPLIVDLAVQGTEQPGHTDEHAHEDQHMGHALPDSASIARLPLRSPKNRIDKLPYVFKDGVKEFHLTVDEFRWEYEPGKWIHAWGYNNQIPGPEIRVNEGDRVRIKVTNNLPDSTSVHWHGIDVNWSSDGVPNLTQKPIPPGKDFTYEFASNPSGTRFYHSHGKDHITSAQQMDMGLSGAFIIEPTTPAFSYSREHTLILDEWEILSGGVNPAISHVHGAAAEGAVPEYNTFTINGSIYPHTDTIKVKTGEKTLIRFINVGTTAFHPMHLHGHNFKVVELDGNPVPRSAVQERTVFTLHPGETAAILVNENNPGKWLLHCHHVHHAAAGMITLLEYDGFNEPMR